METQVRAPQMVCMQPQRLVIRCARAAASASVNFPPVYLMARLPSRHTFIKA
jgi:hypothetical protein